MTGEESSVFFISNCRSNKWNTKIYNGGNLYEYVFSTRDRTMWI